MNNFCGMWIGVSAIVVAGMIIFHSGAWAALLIVPAIIQLTRV